MNNFFLFIFFCPFIFATTITYEFSGGRFGDNLLAYLHAKWLSYQYHIPLSYIPFPYSDRLLLDFLEQRSDLSDTVCLPLAHLSDVSSNEPITYVCPYFPECERELKKSKIFSFQVDWKDPNFREKIFQGLSPQKPLQLIFPPSHTLNIALHYREGGGIDKDSVRFKYPLKLPPFDFYVETLTKVLQMLPQTPIYCYLFTDAKNPEILVQKFQKYKKLSSIQWDFRLNNCNEDVVLDDFFSFFQFDILIRPESNFSIIPSLLHDFAIVCYPTHFIKKSKSIKIDKIKMDINKPLLKNKVNRPLSKLDSVDFQVLLT